MSPSFERILNMTTTHSHIPKDELITQINSEIYNMYIDIILDSIETNTYVNDDDVIEMLSDVMIMCEVLLDMNYN